MNDRKLLDSYLILVPFAHTSDLRVLELGTDSSGSSALELASRYGSVLSVSVDSKVTFAARQAASSPSVAYHCGPLLGGWPDGGPYHLVLHWPPIDRIPIALLQQVGLCFVAPLGIGGTQHVMPTVVLRRVAGELIATVAHADDEIPPDVWKLEPGEIITHDDGYSVVVCKCGTCVRLSLSALAGKVDDDGAS